MPFNFFGKLGPLLSSTVSFKEDISFSSRFFFLSNNVFFFYYFRKRDDSNLRNILTKPEICIKYQFLTVLKIGDHTDRNIHNNNCRLITWSSWLTPVALVIVTVPWSTKINLHINSWSVMDKKLRRGRVQKLKRWNSMFTTSPHQAGVVLILNYLEKGQSKYQRRTRKFSFRENWQRQHI